MPILEDAKRAIENATGIGKPSAKDVRDALRQVEPRQTYFRDDGLTPNNPRLPFLVYPAALDLAGFADPAAAFEQLFAASGWGGCWRDGIFDYLHYHSMTHEALVVARGEARVRFGGDRGADLAVRAGDVVVLPAGTGHQRLEQSRDFLVVGAYPPDGEYDVCRPGDADYDRSVATIAQTPKPKTDPLYGAHGPLLRLWA